MSQEIQESVYKQQEVIKDKQLSVKVDLDQVEPAVIEAQNGIVIHIIIHIILHGWHVIMDQIIYTVHCIVGH